MCLYWWGSNQVFSATWFQKFIKQESVATEHPPEGATDNGPLHTTPIPSLAPARILPRSGVSLSGGDHNVFHGLTIIGEYRDAALKTDKESNLTIDNAYIAQSRDPARPPSRLPLLDQALLDEFKNHESKWLLLNDTERGKRQQEFDALEQKIRRSTDAVERENLLDQLRGLP